MDKRKYWKKRIRKYNGTIFSYIYANKIEDINRKITEEELEEIKDYIQQLKLENGYIQELEEDEKICTRFLK